MDLASLLTGAAAAVRIILLSDAFAEPARQLAKTLNQGIGAVEEVQPGTHILQPCQIGLVGLLAQRQSASFFSLSRACVF